MADEETFREVTDRLGSVLRLYRAMGVEHLFIPPDIRRTIMEGRPAAEVRSEPRTLEELRRWWGECARCRLHGSRTHLVFGEGDPRAELVFVGEGPGADEDRQGRPFVGKAGLLLTDIIEKGFRIGRDRAYIANIVKCRPPGNRDPQPEEIESCLPALWKQIELINPRVIVALGKVAAQTLLETAEPISALRGRFHKARGYAVMPTYHPAYLLRNPGGKREVWEDVKAVLRQFPDLK